MKKKIIHITKSIVFYTLTLFLLSYVLVEVFMPHQTVPVFGFKTYVIVSSSMAADGYNVMDAVVVTRVKEDKLAERDIITFRVFVENNQGIPTQIDVTHYIADIQTVEGEIIYKTQGAGKGEGDYDIWFDEHENPTEITYEDIIGRVSFKIPLAGHVIKIFYSPMLLLLIVVNVGIIIVIVKLLKRK
ncbi:MAG: hypothetical protein IH571_04830 [Acholeplasmataceae bacterium]|nr:hypothetical protein [Acholeplasmataceae bacterium]